MSAQTDRKPRTATPPQSDDDIEIIAYEPSQADQEKRRQFSGLKLLSMLLLSLLGFALWFVFSAKSVWVQIEPQSDTLVVDGGWLRFKWKDHYLMQPGTFRIHATKAGYYELKEQIEVSPDKIQRFQFSMTKLPGMLSFTFGDRVEEAIIEIGDNIKAHYYDKAIEVPAGIYPVVIKSPRYQTYSAEIEVVGLGKEQTFAIDLKPNWADVSITSLPQNAQVFIGDKAIGQTPGAFEILAGEHELSLRARGYKNWFRTLNLSALQQLEIHDIKMQKADGTVSVTTQPAAAISVDGRYIGIAPQQFKLPPGKRYRISASKVGYEKVSQTIEVHSDEDITLNWGLEAQIGEVVVSSDPANAEVWLNGEKIGASGSILSLPVADQDLKIVARGYASKTVSVLPRPQARQTIDVKLLTLEQAREAELQRKRVIATADGQTLLLMRPQPFTMGASRRVRGRRSNEVLRDVDLRAPFYIATKEVTNKLFRGFSAAHDSGSSFKISLNEAEQPVVNVTWDDAARYCNWLSQRDGLPAAYTERGGKMEAVSPGNTGYRMLKESEWAWTARLSGGREDSLFPWGQSDNPPDKFGNFADTSADGLVNKIMDDYSDGFPASAPVGSFEPDAAEIYDLAGNVSEWTHDVYRVGGFAAESSTRSHIFRGSSWQHARVAELRPTYRDFSDQGRADLGFRIGRSLE